MSDKLIVKYILFQVLIVAPLIIGIMSRKRQLCQPELARRLVNLNLMLIEPLVVLWSIWGLDLSGRMLLLPLAGVMLVVAGGIGGFVALKRKPQAPASHATFLISAALANHGFTLGGFICYMLFGEAGLGRAFIFISYFMLFLMGVVFPYARRVGMPQLSAGWLRTYILTPQNLPLVAVLSAITLQLAGVRRPNWPVPVDLLLLISVTIYYFTVGFNFDFSSQGLAWLENCHMALIKFIFVPLVAYGLTRVLPLDPISLKVIQVEAFMPAATYSVVTSVMFRLDARLASGIFVVNTAAFLVLVLPLLVAVF